VIARFQADVIRGRRVVGLGKANGELAHGDG
jgi:hypothetical protein